MADYLIMTTKTHVCILLVLVAASLQSHRKLQQDMANNQGFYNRLANPTLPFCLIGNTPICARVPTPTVQEPNSFRLDTFANECVALLLGYEKETDGFCPMNVVDNTNVDPATQEISQNGFNPPGVNPPCAAIYNPICADNGVTYQNLCYAKQSKVKRISSGPCGATDFTAPTISVPCPCENKFAPVCGNDNVTYQNQCVSLCANVRITAQTACLRPCGCTPVIKPVCSTEMETFQNECLLRCKGKTLLYFGNCPSDQSDNCGHCAGYIQLVCGKNGVTYDNKCYLECAKADLYQSGPCPNARPCTCDDVYLPVCGIDKKTYRNECILKCTNVRKSHNGVCMDDTRPKVSCSSCPQDDSPVCASDGRTYQNECKVKCESGLEILYRGECDPILPKNCKCPGTDRPICGVDGKTYLNECAIKCVGIEVAKESKCWLSSKPHNNRRQSERDSDSLSDDGLDSADPIVQFLNVKNPPDFAVLIKYYEKLFPDHKPITPEYAKYQVRFVKCLKNAWPKKQLIFI